MQAAPAKKASNPQGELPQFQRPKIKQLPQREMLCSFHTAPFCRPPQPDAASHAVHPQPSLLPVLLLWGQLTHRESAIWGKWTKDVPSLGLSSGPWGGQETPGEAGRLWLLHAFQLVYEIGWRHTCCDIPQGEFHPPGWSPKLCTHSPVPATPRTVGEPQRGGTPHPKAQPPCRAPRKGQLGTCSL